METTARVTPLDFTRAPSVEQNTEISARVLTFVRRAMVDVGVPASVLREVLERYGLDLDTATRAPWVAYRDLWVASEDHTRDEALALRVASAIPFGARDALDYALRTCPNARMLLEWTVSFSSTINGASVLSTRKESGGLAVCVRLREGLRGPSSLTDFTVARMLGIVRWTLDPDDPPVAACFTRSAPRDLTRHAAFFRCPLRFDATFNGLVVPEAWLDRPLRHADPHLHRLLRSHPQLALPQSSDSHDLTRRVTDVIERLFAEGVRPAQAIVARRLALSPRTLRRWLEERDTRFAAVLDAARCRVAKRQLSEGARLDEVAEHLGYESTPAFIRAFRRWVGETPAAWRARHASSA
ncbi:MAG: AraC family transcriptional regulator ligand-binding domain-containing protein [Polyangiales bacterium]